MRSGLAARNWFVGLWATLLLAKVALAAHPALFVDEAFYWQEGQHMAWAYSESLPGLTAWMTRLGVAFGGGSTLALRAPFLLLASILPWLVAHPAARELDPDQGWIAGIYAMLLPLAGTLGVLAVPERRDGVRDAAAAWTPDAAAAPSDRFGHTCFPRRDLAISALSHYRFLAVIGVGFVALLFFRPGRRALRDPRVLIAIAFGAPAWAPLSCNSLRPACGFS